MKLRTRFLLVVSILYILVGLGTVYLFYSVTGDVIAGFAERFAAKEAQIQKNRLLTLIDREVVLSGRLADDYVIRRWVLDENNEEARKTAYLQIEGYRKLARDKESFLTIASSQNYYTFTGGSRPVVATLKAEVPEHRWFFQTMKNVDTFALNTDKDLLVHRTKVWINTIMRDHAGRKIAVVGSGVNITVILEEIIGNQEPGISVYLVDEKGVIQASEDHEIVLHNAQALDADKITIFTVMEQGRFGEELKAAIERLRADAAEYKKSGSETIEIGQNENEQDDVITFPVTLKGRTQVAAVSYMRHLGWYNVVILDVGRVISVREFLPILIGLFISLLFLSVLIGLLMHRLVLRPLERMTEATAEVAAGRYGIRLPVERSDEIGRLTSSFNSMAGTIQEYTTDLEAKVQQRTTELQSANTALRQSQKEIDESIRYASMIQASILPDTALFESCFSDYLLLSRPKLVVGGDFHYLRLTDSSIVLAVVDCTGHGVPGAFMTMTAASALNHIVESSPQLNPAAMLSELNRIMKETLRFKEIDAGLDIGLCVIDRQSKGLSYSGAGLSLFEFRDGNVLEHRGDIQRIGYRSSSTDFAYQALTIGNLSGSSFYITTDGILDEPGGSKGFGFGSQRFQEMIRENGHRPMQEQQSVFERILREYRGEYSQRDDQTLIGFRL